MSDISASAKMKLTPMMEQYLRAKQEHPDALLFFRLGDFYELFFEDAERAAQLLDITLTTRSKKDEVPIPMCGVPHHSAQQYIAKLLNLGFKVAVCDQKEDPAAAKGIVAREVTRVFTPGTVTEEEYLDPKQPNYLAALTAHTNGVALAYADLSTGELRTFRAEQWGSLADALVRLAARELLIPEDAADLAALVGSVLPAAVLTRLPKMYFDPRQAEAWLCARGQSSPALDGEDGVHAALAALVAYLKQTHRASLAHLRAPESDDPGRTLILDEPTRRNLELLVTTRGERRGSLFWVLDQTRTAMGARLLRQWLLSPLTSPAAIGARLDAVEFLLESVSVRERLRELLGSMGDLERLAARLAAGRVTPRDFIGLAAALDRVEEIGNVLQGARVPLLEECRAELDGLPRVRERIRTTLSDEPPLNVRLGNVIRPGFDAAIDELRKLARHGKRTIQEMEAAERARTGIPSLKIRYNQVFGYSIEVTRPNLHLVPPEYRRKQTLANCERFVTPELEAYEAKVVGAEERLLALEVQLFNKLVEEIAAEHVAVSRNASALARIDVLAALAQIAERNHYSRPRIVTDRRISIQDGRHPGVEGMAGRSGFVPNDSQLDPDQNQIVLLTGPNMAGKSTYLRQVALITILAQMGSFVPASAAEIGVIDRLFTRIGASDNLAGGESTFMVEMKETAGILNQLTARSLVVLDEIGRGTSTFDGISIAWAVAEYLHDDPRRPLVLFATHYHELTDLQRTRERVKNFSTAVREWKGEVVFLRRIVAGPASQSYGIQVAQLAGVPMSVISRAKEILRNLEAGELTDSGQPRLVQSKPQPAQQLGLFASAPDRLRDELAGIDVNSLTPIEALNRLHDLVEKARRG